MKNKLLTVALLIVTKMACFGQTQDKGFIGISLGSSTPIGDFASSNPNNNSSGYAKSGFLGDVSMGYKFSKYFGGSLLLRGQVNSTDAQSLANEIASEFPGKSVTVKSTAWNIGGFMLGGYGSFPAGNKFSIETKVMAGFLNANSPDILINLTGNNQSAWIKMHSASSKTFSYLVSLGARYNFSKHFCLMLDFDYLGAKPEFKNVLTTDSDGGRTTDTWSQSFGTINYTVGIGYRL